MPDYHPDLDPFAHRDAEPEQPDADRTPVDLHAGAYFVFHQRAHNDAHHFVLYSADGDALAGGVASFGSALVPRTLDLTVYAVRPAPEPAERPRPDAHPDLRVVARREPDGDDPPGRDAGLQSPGGEPGAGAPAVPGGGAVPADAVDHTHWHPHIYRRIRDGSVHTYQHRHRHTHTGLWDDRAVHSDHDPAGFEFDDARA